MVKIICLYKNNYDGKIISRKFDDYGVFGKWIADNAVEISLLDVIQEEE